jgi:hypothetical protein
MFKKKRLEEELSMAEINSRIRGFILDSQVQHPHELSARLGLPHISDEVAEREEQESDKRFKKIEFLVPMLYAFSHVMAEASVEYQRSTIEGADKLPPEVWTYSRKMLEQTAVSILLGSISQLVDMDVLHIARKVK